MHPLGKQSLPVSAGIRPCIPQWTPRTRLNLGFVVNDYENSPEARRFGTERLRMLLVGKAGRVIVGLKQVLAKRDLSNAARHSLNQVVGYLERNRKHMRYEICLAQGYPIGSGVIEGACRNLINKYWDEFWTYRRQQERLRLYGIKDSSSAGIRDLELPRVA
jgi:hypothetical protein